ncbi:hypothetical protein D5S19_11140 [Amycolatopsis panacis]|uniref:Uncharacterized protein n=1 Tax=Amycolatopsis panacis TaxID=2340917 RepID=A0A419I613_9PSEU|nr:hypothetical protein D5S19_11140 [Amycolatopsis panacis]
MTTNSELRFWVSCSSFSNPPSPGSPPAADPRVGLLATGEPREAETALQHQVSDNHLITTETISAATGLPRAAAVGGS